MGVIWLCCFGVFGWSCEPKNRGTPTDPSHYLVLFSFARQWETEFVGTVPLLQWRALKSPDDVTKQGWTRKGATRSDKGPNSTCWMTRAKLRPVFLVSDRKLRLCGYKVGQKQREKTERKKERKKERKAHCMWGTIRKAAPIEDWSRLLYEVYISATKRAHTACFVPKGWPTQKIHTNAATNWSAHISTQKCSSTLMWTNHGLHNHCPTTLSCFQSPQRKPHADPGWALLEVGGIIATVNPGSDIKRQLSLTSCSVTHWQTLNARRSGKLHSVFPVWQLADSSL